MGNKSVSIVIPAYNEGNNISATLEGIASQGDFEIIVVDDGSNDDTSDKALKSGVNVIRLPVNSGKGKALEKGVQKVTGEIIVFLDADLGESSSEVTKLLKPIIDGFADVTVARFPRYSKRRGGFGFAKGLARMGIKLLTGEYFDEPLSGQRAMGKEILSHLSCFEQGFGVEVGMTIDLVKAGYRVVEVDTKMYHADTGRDLRGFLHRGRQFRDIFTVLVKRLIKFGVVRRSTVEKVGNG
jgi:glycosyltransferase involved in cell wall biosynthesis